MTLRMAGSPQTSVPDMGRWAWSRIGMVICMLLFALACQLFHAFVQLQIVENLVCYVASISSYGEWSKWFQNTLSYLGFTNHPSSCCFPSQLCLGHQKFSTSARQQIFWKLFSKNGSICISTAFLCVFASQKETKVLSEALHEMKEENKLLKQKNASMIRKQEHYECEISRLNKVGTRMRHWLENHFSL